MTATDTVSNAVARRDSGPQALIAQYRGDFSQVLPDHLKPDTWVRLAQGVLRRDRNLARVAESNPGSFMSALLECARLGHEPATNAFYLIPFGNEVQGIEGYRGIVQRIYRAGAVTSVKAEIVYEADHFRYTPNMERPEHEADWFGDRGEVRGVYAYAEMLGGGTSRVALANRAYIEKVRKESRGSNSATSPWNKWYDQMVLKTGVRRLEPWVPTSTSYLKLHIDAVRAAAVAETERAEPQPVDVTHLPEIEPAVEGEIVEEGA